MINIDMRNFAFSDSYMHAINDKVTQEQLLLAAENKLKTVEAEHRYATVDDLYGSGHPPDSVVMGALAYRAASHRALPTDVATQGSGQASVLTFGDEGRSYGRIRGW